jgi:ribosomal-protein-alanine N-acetyltransferase
MRGLKIRLAEPRDLDAVYSVERASFKGDVYPRSLLLALLILNPQGFFVAEVEGKVVGYAVGALIHGRGHVMSLAVHPHYRRRGIATALMKTLEEALTSKGATELRLEVREDNVEAAAFYEKLGYRAVGRRSRYYSDGSSAIVYSKPAGCQR